MWCSQNTRTTLSNIINTDKWRKWWEILITIQRNESWKGYNGMHNIIKCGENGERFWSRSKGMSREKDTTECIIYTYVWTWLQWDGEKDLVLAFTIGEFSVNHTTDLLAVTRRSLSLAWCRLVSHLDLLLITMATMITPTRIITMIVAHVPTDVATMIASLWSSVDFCSGHSTELLLAWPNTYWSSPLSMRRQHWQDVKKKVFQRTPARTYNTGI